MKKSRSRVVVTRADYERIRAAGQKARKDSSDVYLAACKLIEHAQRLVDVADELSEIAERGLGNSP